MAVCGGIAAYKSAQLVRLLRKQGADVRVVMTQSAMQFVTPLTFQALTGNPVHSELLDADEESAMDHINLARWADFLLVAPATANVIAKFSHGLADDLLSTIYLAATCPVYVVPAMNQAMWLKPVTRENIERLKVHGITIWGPAQGEQACGETGPGRMLEPEEICSRILAEAKPGILQGTSLLITAGPTREPLDPVRYITNRSSGKMGYALAQAALEEGGEVTLVSGPVALEIPENVDVIQVESASDMYDAVIGLAESHDIYIGAAAVADYSPTDVQPEKIKKQDAESSIKLHRTKDILAEVAALKKRPFTVGFAAETHDVEQYARSKLERKNLDLIAANQVGQESGGFDSDLNALQVLWKGGQVELKMTEKTRLARQLIKLIAEKFNEKRTT